jgi:hypothetical protein
MRLFIDEHYFISVITEERGFNCQIMELVHGMGMYPATILENQEDVVSCIVFGIFKEESKICKDLNELFEYHQQCVIEITTKCFS